MRRLLFLGSFILTLNGCVTVPNVRICTAAGDLTSGAICAETQTGKTSDMTLDQFIEFLEPQPERPDPDHPGQTLPARGGAICQSTDDFTREKTALEKACRELGSACSMEMRAAIQSLNLRWNL